MSEARIEQQAAEMLETLRGRGREWEWHRLIDSETSAPYESHDAMARDALLAYGHGGLDLWGVGMPTDERGDGDYLAVCVTGNGPTSEAHARFVASAPGMMRTLIDEIDSLRTRVRNLQAVQSEVTRLRAGIAEIATAVVSMPSVHARCIALLTAHVSESEALASDEGSEG